ncbi:MAG: hypothetical protein FWE53_02030 [Firmicutes bacterium]|nr:hypothetical protein [Bacillota bacterium]
MKKEQDLTTILLWNDFTKTGKIIKYLKYRRFKDYLIKAENERAKDIGVGAARNQLRG